MTHEERVSLLADRLIAYIEWNLRWVSRRGGEGAAADVEAHRAIVRHLRDLIQDE